MDRLSLARDVIQEEYQSLCRLFSVNEVSLDIYAVVEDAPQEVRTLLGTPLRNATPGYSAKTKLMVLPLLDGDEWPTSAASLPPLSWSKWDWPIWRIELWHEFVHQISDQIFEACDPTEPGRIRANRSVGAFGHGNGWWQAVVQVASEFSVDPDLLDKLVD